MLINITQVLKQFISMKMIKEDLEVLKKQVSEVDIPFILKTLLDFGDFSDFYSVKLLWGE